MMAKRCFWTLALAAALSCGVCAQEPGQSAVDAQALSRAAAGLDAALPDGALVAAAAQRFLRAPYRAGTLEGSPEVLRAPLEAFDCATLLDASLALATAVRLEAAAAGKEALCSQYLRALRSIRYREGVVAGYASRLHYALDWIDENVRAGHLRDLGPMLGGEPLALTLGRLSRTLQAAGKSADAQRMRSVEAAIAARPHWFIPSGRVPGILGALQPGDLLVFVSAHPGVDAVHMAVFLGGPTGAFIHASSDVGHVAIRRSGLASYLAVRKGVRGIAVARPILPKRPMAY